MEENFRYKTSNYTLHFVLRQIKSGRMDVTPAFLDLKQKSRKENSLFVESLLLGMPTQPIWCEESRTGDFFVLEGSERLTALVDFVEGQFALTNLKIRKEYNGLFFYDLPFHEKLSLEDRYPLTFIIINYDTHPHLKCEFFRRLLTSTGTNGDQSARNFAWRSSFEFLQNMRLDCGNLVEFSPQNSRWHSDFDSFKKKSAIDEVFLFLAMISIILNGDLFEEAYLDSNITVDDLLDWTMNYFDGKSDQQFLTREKIFRILYEISSLIGERSKVSLTKGFQSFRQDDGKITLSKFYFLFVKLHSNKTKKLIAFKEIKPRRIANSMSAPNFISYIFQMRND